MATTRVINYRIVHVLNGLNVPVTRLFKFDCTDPIKPSDSELKDGDNLPNYRPPDILDAIFLPPGSGIDIVKAGTAELIRIGPFKRPAIIVWVNDGTPQGQLQIFNCLYAAGQFISTLPEWCAAKNNGTAQFAYPCEDAKNFDQNNPPAAQVPPPSP